MADVVIGKEIDKTGAEVTVKLAPTIGNSKIVPFFLKNYAKLIEDGLAHPIITFNNKNKAVYAEINGQVVGHIVYEVQEDVAKTGWITFSCIDDNFRQRGIYNILHRHFETTVKQAGSKKIASHVHVTNMPRQASCASVGMKPVFYRMEKELK
jgi:ribosomal protein S18 acetylase RimI-like enzyme